MKLPVADVHLLASKVIRYPCSVVGRVHLPNQVAGVGMPDFVIGFVRGGELPKAEGLGLPVSRQ